MKAITLWQPWASLCVIRRPVPCACDGTGTIINTQDGGYAEACQCTGPRVPFKTIETRSWKAPDSLIGQRIAIHAAVKRPENGRLGPIVCMGDGPPRSTERFWIEGPNDLYAPLPLGAVVGTAVLADCVPMANPRWTDPVRPYLWVNEDDEDAPHDLVLYRDGVHGENVSDQAPFGHFEQGRWAWLLADAERFDEPIPATGRQGIWNWEPTT